MNCAKLTRRGLVLSLLATPLAPALAHGEPTLRDMVSHPMLRKICAIPPHHIDANGGVGVNFDGFRLIEEQRQGADFIISGLVSNREDWIATGWKVLDYGLAHQVEDGGFGKFGSLHSTSLFVEGLARACILDPHGATPARVDALRFASHWLLAPHAADRQQSLPYTHRRYILAAAMGQSGRVLSDGDLKRAAHAWATEGFHLQQPDGANPEGGGIDVSYQMVGVLFACRYYPSCDSPDVRSSLERMVRRAVGWEAPRIGATGEIDASGSTRIGKESFAGHVKAVNYFEVYQALVYAGQLFDPSWLEPASRIGQRFHWT